MPLKCLCCCGELVQRRLLLLDTPLRCADCGCEFDEDELAEYCSGGMVRVADIAGNSSGDLVLSAETGAEKILLGGLAAGCAACFAGMFFIPALFAVLLMLAGCGAFRLYSLCSGGAGPMRITCEGRMFVLKAGFRERRIPFDGIRQIALEYFEYGRFGRHFRIGFTLWDSSSFSVGGERSPYRFAAAIDWMNRRMDEAPPDLAKVTGWKDKDA